MNSNSQQTFDFGRICRDGGVRHVEYHAELDSTNGTAADLCEQLLLHAPAVVLTSRQTAGRGRGGNGWWSSAGALTFSVLLDAQATGIPPERRSLVSLAAGVAVREAVAQWLPLSELLIKWPNDVYCRGQKLCGILTEQLIGHSATAIIIGIGINVNNSLEGAPDLIRTRATSIYDQSRQSVDLTGVLVQVLQKLQQHIRQLADAPADVVTHVNRHSLLSGRKVVVRAQGNLHSGLCGGINADGGLILIDSDNHTRHLISGEVVEWSD